jgi:hypothetical protein
MKVLLILSILLLFGISSAVIDLSGTSPKMAKGFAEANNLTSFQPWIMPTYGHYATEFWPDVDAMGRPNSLMLFMAADVAIPPSIENKRQ